VAILQYSGTLRSNQVAQIESTITPTPTLTIWPGTMPTNCAAANAAGPQLATIALPADWLVAGAAGVVGIATGPWQDLAADNAGTATHFRIHAGATCHMQGDITTTVVGTGAMLLDNVVFAAGQAFSITAFTITAGNA
jgi:hypothetical protein